MTNSSSTEKREYRLVTGGEDGQVMWWNFTADFKSEWLCKTDNNEVP